jgi:prepilin-type N-terminal cleavage/methylation domain-containing protein
LEDPALACPNARTRAFTLIELMIVIAIITILAAILIPNFLHARAESLTAACEGNEKMIATGLEEYAVDHSGSYGGGGAVTSTLLGAPYLGITPSDPVNATLYTVTTSAGTYGAYLITDSGGHDVTTTGRIPNGPGTGSIVYMQNSGLAAK